MNEPIIEADLLEKIAGVLKSEGGTITSRDARTVLATLTAIESKWFLGGRKVTDTVTCRLAPEAREVHLRETATETSWGLPPPTFTVETTVQAGSRLSSIRTDKAVEGGGRLEFGRFREDIEKVAKESGWKFVHELV